MRSLLFFPLVDANRSPSPLLLDWSTKGFPSFPPFPMIVAERMYDCDFFFHFVFFPSILPIFHFFFQVYITWPCI